MATGLQCPGLRCSAGGRRRQRRRPAMVDGAPHQKREMS